jgi:hypothetical protein
VLRDAVLGVGGTIGELEVDHEGATTRIPAAGAVVVPTRASAA